MSKKGFTPLLCQSCVACEGVTKNTVFFLKSQARTTRFVRWGFTEIMRRSSFTYFLYIFLQTGYARVVWGSIHCNNEGISLQS